MLLPVQDSPPGRHSCGTPNGSLSKEINTATRQVHTHLNRLIINRLPLALPPNTGDPAIYATGLLHFANIYVTFESAWIQALERPPKRISRILEQLHIPQLLRTARLKKDLATLLSLPPHEVDNRLDDAQASPHLIAFINHITFIIAQKPHVIIAYAWVMYMALFNGGRWIRTQLISARDSAWTLPSSKTISFSADSKHERALSFWHFPGPHDGEDIKNEFKSRLDEVESQLTLEERQDIVGEARVVFENCALLVGELDEILAAKQKATPSDSMAILLKHILPMGMTDLVTALASRIGLITPSGPGRAEQAKGG